MNIFIYIGLIQNRSSCLPSSKPWPQPCSWRKCAIVSITKLASLVKASLIFRFLLNMILNYSFGRIKTQLLQLFFIHNFFMNGLSRLLLLAKVVPWLLSIGRDALWSWYFRWRLVHRWLAESRCHSTALQLASHLFLMTFFCFVLFVDCLPINMRTIVAYHRSSYHLFCLVIDFGFLVLFHANLWFQEPAHEWVALLMDNSKLWLKWDRLRL
jgi:hypothetical protein